MSNGVKKFNKPYLNPKKQLFYFPTPSKSKSFYNIPWVLILWFKESQKQILKLQSCFSNLLLFTNFISIGFLYRNVFVFHIINRKLSILKEKKIVKKKSGICSFRLIAGKKIELKNLTYLIGTVQSRFSDILFSDNFAKDHF